MEHNKPNWDKLQAISVLTSDSPKPGPALKKNPYIYELIFLISLLLFCFLFCSFYQLPKCFCQLCGLDVLLYKVLSGHMIMKHSTVNKYLPPHPTPHLSQACSTSTLLIFLIFFKSLLLTLCLLFLVCLSVSLSHTPSIAFWHSNSSKLCQI